MAPKPEGRFFVSQNLQQHQAEALLSERSDKPGHSLGPLYLRALGRGQRWTLYPSSPVAYHTRFRAQFHVAEAT